MLIVLGSKDPEEDRQADRPAAQTLQVHDEHDHHPTVSPARPASRALRLGTVVQVVRAPHPPARAPEQRVIDGEANRRVRRHEYRHQEVQQPQPELVGLPAPVGEEVVRTTVMPLPGEPHHQHAERPVRRLREARRKQGQQTSERTGNLKHGGDLPVEGPRERSLRPTAGWVYTHRIRGRRQPSLRPLNHSDDARQHHPPRPSPEHPQTPENPETRVTQVPWATAGCPEPYFRTTSTTPITSSANPAIRGAPTGCLVIPSRPTRSIATETASCPVIPAAASPLAPRVRTVTIAIVTNTAPNSPPSNAHQGARPMWVRFPKPPLTTVTVSSS